jgi:hypothetical protein
VGDLVAHHAVTELEHLGDLGGRHAPEHGKLHDAAGPGIHLGQAGQSAVQVDDFLITMNHQDVPQLDGLLPSTPLLGPEAAGVVNQDAAHGLGRQRP